MKTYDIVVIGGGPSSSSFGKYISENFDVLIIDKRDFGNNNIIKSCGGLLAHDGQDIFSGLGYAMPKEVLVDPQVFYVKVHDFNTNQIGYYYKSYINMNREKFDNYLLSEINTNITLKKNALFKNYVKENNLIKVQFVENNVLKEVYTKILVGADGANSKVRNILYNNKKINKQYITIQKVYKTNKILPHNIAIFDNEINDFYSWVIPKDKTLVVGSTFNINNKGLSPNKKFQILEEKLKKQGYSLEEIISTEGAIINKPKINQFYLGENNIVLIGESACLISPSSSEGISYALKSGYLLANELNRNFNNGIVNYKKKTYSLRMKINFKNIKANIMYNNFFRKYIIASKIFQSNQVFDKNK